MNECVCGRDADADSPSVSVPPSLYTCACQSGGAGVCGVTQAFSRADSDHA